MSSRVSRTNSAAVSDMSAWVRCVRQLRPQAKTVQQPGHGGQVVDRGAGRRVGGQLRGHAVLLQPRVHRIHSGRQPPQREEPDHHGQPHQEGEEQRQTHG